MIVETGYSYAWAIGSDFNYSSTYPYTEEGQRRFTADLIALLNKHASVNGLFWWWPEDNGNKDVTQRWWNAALYNHDTGKPYAAFYELKKFVGAGTGIETLYIPKEGKVQRNGRFTVDGRKVQGEPNVKGIYIMNGRKAVN